MEQRKLGKSGLTVSALGLGCMGMSEWYGTRDEGESLATLALALDRGLNFWDTADAYGIGKNEELVGRALRGHRDEVVLATKFGIVRDASDPTVRGISGRPEYVRQSCERSLKRLGVEVIDLYYLHRVAQDATIEETVGAMADLVREGKIRHIGLSEASPDTLRRAVKVAPIAALQSEYSLWSRDAEDGVLETCHELGIGFVAYSPLGRGFLTGQLKRFEDFPADDYRRFTPRFQGDNFKKNLALVAKIEELARGKNCTAAQLALAWVLSRSKEVVPIPGTKRRRYLTENLGALDVALSPADLKAIDAVAPKGVAAGLRYPESMMSAVNR
jgi:aryl-alcohol dehydrogenase-like predicted oxidoreductase